MVKRIIYILILDFIFVLFLFSNSACQQNKQIGSENEQKEVLQKMILEDIDAETFKSKIGLENHIILDVRTEEEVNEGMIPGAIVIDFNQDDFRQKVDQLDKSKTYLIYCRSGNRSGKAGKVMEELAFEKVYNLKGGFMNWPY